MLGAPADGALAWLLRIADRVCIDQLRRRDPLRPQFTDHCFTGEYPTRLRDREGPPQQKQLSFLAEVG